MTPDKDPWTAWEWFLLLAVTAVLVAQSVSP